MTTPSQKVTSKEDYSTAGMVRKKYMKKIARLKRNFDKSFGDGENGTISMFFDDGGWTTARTHHIKDFIQDQLAER